MLESEFLNIVESNFSKRKELLCSPSKRRMGGTFDRLSQFKRMAYLRKVKWEQVPLDLCSKQFTDIIDMVDGSHEKAGDLDYLTELINDVQNYLDLTLALCIERMHTYEL